MRISKQILSVTAKFPAHRNRELLLLEQGILNNTDAARDKFQEELEDTHKLFKSFVTENRPQLEIEMVATGEHWYGTRALERKLIDIIQTSDDYLLAASKDRDIFEVHYKRRRPLQERLASGIRAVVKGVSGERWQDRIP